MCKYENAMKRVDPEGFKQHHEAKRNALRNGFIDSR